jgi:DNA-binding Xre family transcriptional regulator
MRPKFKSELRNKTIKLLNDTHIELKQIAKETGLSESWLSALKLGHLSHSDVGRVETLHNYLNKSPLKV